MSFNNEDILILAKAGFNAQQIAALNQVQAPQQIQQTVQEPQQTVQPPQQIQQTVQAPQQTVQAPQQVQQTVQAPGQGASIDDVLKSVQDLTSTFQNGFLLNSTQPQQLSAEDVLAQIINPPINDKK